MIETLKFCDTDGRCYFHEDGTDPDDATWAHINGKDFCPHHTPCPNCGHDSVEHVTERGDIAQTCQVGREYVYEHQVKARVNDLVVWGERVMVEPGCGCTHDTPQARLDTL